MIRLDNKIALVTGASRGIGQAIAEKLADLGANVVGTATSQKGADDITERLKNKPIPGQGIVLDVKDSKSIQAVFKTMEETKTSPHIVINNAGVTRDQLLMRMSEEDWQVLMDTNLTSLFHICKAAIRPMMKAKTGRIINIASVVGVMGNAGQTNYAAAKAGMIGFSKSLAREIGAKGVTVNVVAPGFIETDMTRELSESQREALLQQVPLKKLGQVEDIAATVAFLASDMAGYITGETLHVNGGLYMI